MSLQAKTALVTGATSGIGLEAARQLAGLGARVLVHGRTREKADLATADVSRHGDAEPVWGDFERLSEVHGLVQQVRATSDALDVLVHNAGVFMNERVVTTDGHETTLQVNHLAPFLLTMGLFDTLCAAKGARVITVTSVAHFRGTLALDDLEQAREYTGFSAYANSKLYNVLFAQELAERLSCEGATSNAVHPGTVETKLLAAGWPSAEGASTSDGATGLVYLASSPVVADVSGAYFVEKRQAHASPRTGDPEARRLLWQASERLIARSP